MKRIFWMLLVVAIFVATAISASAEERMYTYYGYVIGVSTQDNDAYFSDFDHPVDTKTTFHVYSYYPLLNTSYGYNGVEVIVNGGEAGDKSAMIAVVGEAFTSGQVILVTKKYYVPDEIVIEEKAVLEKLQKGEISFTDYYAQLEKIRLPYRSKGKLVSVAIKKSPKLDTAVLRPLSGTLMTTGQ